MACSTSKLCCYVHSYCFRTSTYHSDYFQHVQWRAYTEDDNATLQGRHVQWRAYTEDDNATLRGRHVQWRAYTEDDSSTKGAACTVKSVHWRWQLHYTGRRVCSTPAALHRTQCLQHTSCTTQAAVSAAHQLHYTGRSVCSTPAII